MSFTFTEKEKGRVVFASLVGVTLDHIGKADLATIIAITVLYSVQLLAVVYMVLNRNYPPIRAKGVLTMTCVYICGISWFIGGLGTHEVLHLSNKFWSNCTLHIVWLRPVTGEAFIFNLLYLRCIRLFFKYQLHRPFEGMWKYMITITSFAIPVICAVIITLLPKKETVSFVDVLEICNMSPRFKDASTALNWTALGTFVVGCLLIHRTICFFGENRELEVGCIAFIVAQLYHTLVYYKYNLYPSLLKWRLSIILVEQAAVYIAWWTIMYKPLYQCLVHRDEYMVEWSKRADPVPSLHSKSPTEGAQTSGIQIQDHQAAVSHNYFVNGSTKVSVSIQTE
ncbi:hypothetical protein DL89DRAFT_316814 [Linderina pennispora]|uniref:Uncharacterized protein n=1 Tax=Linderina pennispora TaxID=61395 RepID=A0A1Y1W7P4_9FUNG|nr:uncharacterized protein DL89DRAFT_316814 [Linderina pennispora]ORX69405.1 hypothetical protein DL89DRAFT_316814 [Linderina pennispora]